MEKEQLQQKLVQLCFLCKSLPKPTLFITFAGVQRPSWGLLEAESSSKKGLSSSTKAPALSLTRFRKASKLNDSRESNEG